jgi:hypothetical protein
MAGDIMLKASYEYANYLQNILLQLNIDSNNNNINNINNNSGNNTPKDEGEEIGQTLDQAKQHLDNLITCISIVQKKSQLLQKQQQ